MNTKKLTYKYSLLAILTFGLMILGPGCCVDPDCNDLYDDNDDNHYSEEIDDYQEIPLTTQGTLSLEGVNGEIRIEGTMADTVIKVWIEKEVRADSHWEAERYLEELDVRVTTNEAGVFVETRQPSKNDVTFIVDYHILVPERFDVNVENVNGKIDIRALKGDIQADMTNGDVAFFNCESSIWSDVTNGDIGADIMLPENGTCDFSITNGTIELGIPDVTSAELEAGIVNGNISIQGLDLENSEVTNRSAKGTLGDGNGLIKLKVTNGIIRVLGKEKDT